MLQVSGKGRRGVSDLLRRGWSDRCRPLRGTPRAPTRAMISDSVYDIYRGVVTYVRVVERQDRTPVKGAS